MKKLYKWSGFTLCEVEAHVIESADTAQKNEFSSKYFFSKCDQNRRKLRI